MYGFRYMLPFLPVDYRRKICFSVCCTYGIFQQAKEPVDEVDFVTIHHLYAAIQDYEMNKLEIAGKTNTSINPFDVSHLPPALIGG